MSTIMDNRNFKEGLAAGVLLTLSLSVMVYMMLFIIKITTTTPGEEAWKQGPDYFSAYKEGIKTIPYMQEQDSIDNAVLNLQQKYHLTDDMVEDLYSQLVD